MIGAGVRGRGTEGGVSASLLRGRTQPAWPGGRACFVKELRPRPRRRARAATTAIVAAVGVPSLASAAGSVLPSVSLQIGNGDQQVASSLQIVGLLTLLSLAPAILIMLTGFV